MLIVDPAIDPILGRHFIDRRSRSAECMSGLWDVDPMDMIHGKNDVGFGVFGFMGHTLECQNVKISS